MRGKIEVMETEGWFADILEKNLENLSQLCSN